MSRFSLVTRWHLDAPIDRVWDAIFHAEDWPRWWKYVERVDDIEAGSPSGVGAVRRFTWKTALLYTLTFDLRATLIEPPYAIKGTASGEVEGTGTWRLTARDGLTRVRHEWDVRPTKAWMNALAPAPPRRSAGTTCTDARRRPRARAPARRAPVLFRDPRPFPRLRQLTTRS